MGLILESDARNHGEVLVNGNSQIVTYKDGVVRFVKHTKQRTDSTGGFLGSTVYSPDEETRALIEDEELKSVAPNAEKGYYGVQGVDYFLVNQGGTKTVYITEINARWNGSSYPTIIADKLGSDSWISTAAVATNLKTGKHANMRTIEDFIKAVGRDLAFGNTQSGLVVPIMFRSYVSWSSAVYSPNISIQIIRNSTEHCDEIVQLLLKKVSNVTSKTPNIVGS